MKHVVGDATYETRAVPPDGDCFLWSVGVAGNCMRAQRSAVSDAMRLDPASFFEAVGDVPCDVADCTRIVMQQARNVRTRDHRDQDAWFELPHARAWCRVNGTSVGALVLFADAPSIMCAMGSNASIVRDASPAEFNACDKHLVLRGSHFRTLVRVGGDAPGDASPPRPRFRMPRVAVAATTTARPAPTRSPLMAVMAVTKRRWVAADGGGDGDGDGDQPPVPYAHITSARYRRAMGLDALE